MPLPSLYVSVDGARPWSVMRAAVYGAGVGVLASLFKLLASSRMGGAIAPHLPEIVGAAFLFAILCAGAAALRNFLARRFT